ncbi:unknown [Crocosphaera subtropica ATCC 51142]|uniref:Polymerase/histidinol phosphatase N-terminal domain-containing protein n=1 Tax=Crocosphaera subtropica (strain ATCC 51142 / BH68) TaxID=43989 RepID=B1WQI6_CROS5|nr:PHP domain-containing protein [Crocosphaera subtropica]ACB51697.1 unknown [Crocosphaera subtropica ATCC 51142]
MIVSNATKPSSQDTQSLQEVWSRLNTHSCPYEYNFHMHTICSDGQLTPEQLIQQATRIGLKGLAITDHHSVEGYKIAQKWLHKRSLEDSRESLPHLWTGIEITSRLLDIEVHILGYGFNPEHWAIEPYLWGESPQGTQGLASHVIHAIHQAGGMAVLAHPERYSYAATKVIPVAVDLGIDGVEAFYAYNNPKPWKTSPRQTETVLNLSYLYGLYHTCGTDTHGLNLLQRI